MDGKMTLKNKRKGGSVQLQFMIVNVPWTWKSGIDFIIQEKSKLTCVSNLVRKSSQPQNVKLFKF